MIFKKGFSYIFDENACKDCGGKCCTGESGNIFINQDEITLLRKYLGLEEEAFKMQYLKKVGNKMSLKELEFEDGFACIFFNQKERNCGIYPFRPYQCRTFPFWEYFKTHKEELQKECIGICYLS